MGTKKYICVVLCFAILFGLLLLGYANASTIKQDAYHEAAETLRSIGVEEGNEVLRKLSEAWYRERDDVVALANVAYPEAKGIKSVTEVANVMWVILNRVDNPKFPNSVFEVVTQKYQFAYNPSAPLTTSDRHQSILAGRGCNKPPDPGRGGGD